MGHPVPVWDGAGQIGNLRRVGNPPVAPVDRGTLWVARSLPGCPTGTGIVYYLNMHVGRSRTRAVIQEAEHLELSERDSLRVLALLENPPKPNPKLLAAAKVLPNRK
jgi:hypothetical protein